MKRRLKRTVKTVIVIVIAVGAIASLPPLTWHEAEGELRRHIRSVETMVHPAAARSAEWFERQTHALRDRLGGIEVGVGEASQTRKEQPIRIARGSDALTGPARVIDGDTLDVGGVRIRLHGIDAPESKQSCRTGGQRWSCGREATRALAGRIGGRSVACEERDQDRYGRVVAVCSLSGTDLNGWMVAQGWAFAYRRYSRAYVAEESGARAARRGMWRGYVVPPWDWRRGERLAGTRATSQRDSGRCTIKGNIGKSGTRIYHVPGGRYYEQTRINTSKGERWFCTEGEARAAGWRRSRQ